jgi:chromosome partitioning protein
MRRIAVINQKGGVGKTTTAANLGATLAEQGRRVVLVDLDAQGNLTTHLGLEAPCGSPSIYTVLLGQSSFADALRETATPRLSVVPSNIDLSGAELELASAIGRETLLLDAIETWCGEGDAPADYVLFDCPPSLGLLSINGLAAAREVQLVVQTEFLALQGMSKLVDVVQLIRKRLNPDLAISGIVPCLYDSRLRLAREVLAEIRRYFPGEVFKTAIRSNVKLAEAPSFGQHVLEYAPSSNGSLDYRKLAQEVIAQESRDAALAGLPEAKSLEALVKEARASARESVVELTPAAPAAGEEVDGAVRAEDLPPLPVEVFKAPAETE